MGSRHRIGPRHGSGGAGGRQGEGGHTRGRRTGRPWRTRVFVQAGEAVLGLGVEGVAWRRRGCTRPGLGESAERRRRLRRGRGSGLGVVAVLLDGGLLEQEPRRSCLRASSSNGAAAARSPVDLEGLAEAEHGLAEVGGLLVGDPELAEPPRGRRPWPGRTGPGAGRGPDVVGRAAGQEGLGLAGRRPDPGRAGPGRPWPSGSDSGRGASAASASSNRPARGAPRPSRAWPSGRSGRPRCTSPGLDDLGRPPSSPPGSGTRGRPRSSQSETSFGERLGRSRSARGGGAASRRCRRARGGPGPTSGRA